MSQSNEPDSNRPGQSFASAPGRPPVDPGSGFPPPPPPGFGHYAPQPPPPKRQGIFSRIAVGIVTSVFLSSLLLNLWFAIVLASQLRGPSESTFADGDSTRRIVIVPISGTIDDSTASFARQALKILRERPPVAIILRVDSPGGGVSASDRIWHEISEYKKAHPNIPIVASFGGVAASGGYYVSAPADLIVAEPTTITGSIGVIAQAFTVEKLLDKVGVTPETITSTQANKKDQLSPFHAWTDVDRAELRNILDQAHARFAFVVAQGRKAKLSEEETAKIANGSIFTCKEALEAKIVDEEGYLDHAITRAQALAKIDASAKLQVTTMDRPRSLGILGALASDAPSPQSTFQPESARRWLAEMGTIRLEYRWAR